MEILKTLPISSWQESFTIDFQADQTQSLENGQVLFFPKLPFQLTSAEQSILSPQYVSKKSKNISLDITTKKLRGVASEVAADKSATIHSLLTRFALQSQQLVNALFPLYTKSLIIGRTSFRPVEIKGRISSYRKDDTRLHVDAFPANPNQGKRILRVFSNINIDAAPRVWRLGEPFADVAQQFLSILKNPIPFSANILHGLGITKSYRTVYDHYMLQLHDAMKADVHYQQTAAQSEIHFPAASSWIVQTDHVSHAAMAGQHLLEQTFYLPIEAMQDQNKSPLRVLEKLLGKSLR